MNILVILLVIISFKNFINACEYSHQLDETKCYDQTFEYGHPIELKKYGKKISFILIKGEIYSDTFPLINGVEEIIIRSSNITQFSPNFFNSFPNLHKLTITINHGFPNITKDLFKFCCKNLKILDISDNNFKLIDNEIFKNMENLEELSIEKQYLGPLKENYFDGLKNLKTLHLQYCQIKSIHKNAFNNLNNLIRLDLPLNEVEIIEGGTFENLNKLEQLQLSGNIIRNFTGKEFSGLIHLKYLKLIDNRINSINLEKIFENLPKLESISIKLAQFECNKAKNLMEKIQENNIHIQNPQDVLSDKCH